MPIVQSSQLGINSLPFPIALINSEFKFIETSAGFIKLFNLKHPHKQPLSLLDLISELPKSHLPKTELPIREGFKEVITSIKNSNKLKWLKLKFHLNFNIKNTYYVQFEDITKEKLINNLACDIEEVGRIGSWNLDLANSEFYWSDVTKEIHEVPSNFKPELEKALNFFLKGENREQIHKLVYRAINDGISYDEKFKIVTGRGNVKWIRAIGKAEQLDGKTVSLYGIIQDIDEGQRRALVYDNLNKKMRIGIKSAKVGVWDFDIVNDELFWDDTMYELYGHNRMCFTGDFEAWESTIYPEDRCKAMSQVQLAIDEKNKFDTEFRVIKEDNSIAFIRSVGEVFRDYSGKPIRIIGANMDISRIKNKDQRLRQLLNVTEKQNQRLFDFTNIVSHNLRSNASNISMLSGMLNLEVSAKEQKKFIEMIQTSSERLDETIAQLNEVVKVQGTSKYDMHQIPVKSTLIKTIESINALMLTSSVDLKIDITDCLRVYAVKSFLNSVFLNLLTNSIKYRKSLTKLKITVKAEVCENHTVISFADNGIGIDLKKNGAKLFGMYKTFHKNKDAKGIGLFITKNHMDAMHGKIEVDSSLGKGTTFYLYFSNNRDNS